MRISRRPYLRQIEAETVVMHMRDGASIRGVLTAAYSDVYVLRCAAFLGEGGTSLAIDGETLIPLGRVAFIQRILEREDS